MNNFSLTIIGLAASLATIVSGATPMAHVKTKDGERPLPVVAIDNVCAWPNLTLMPDGAIVATIFNQPSHLTRPGDVECWASDDGGATWEKRGTPGPGKVEDVARGNVAAGVANNGDLVVLVSGWSGPFVGNERGHVLPTWVSRSADGGRTWLIDRETFPKLPTGVDGIPFGDILPGKDGALRAAIYRGATYICRSEDDGKTWGDPVLLDGDAKTNEVAIFHSGEGQWLAAARLDGMNLYSSTDDGASWTFRKELTGPRQHPGHILRLADGRLLVSYGNRNGPRGVDVRFSDDEGASWSEPYRVLAFGGDGGYPSSVQLPDGNVLTAYYASSIEGHDRYHMGTVVWDPETTVGR